MSKIVIQMGHVPRTSGKTGTHREQEFVKIIGPLLRIDLLSKGHRVFLIGADEPVPICNVFVSLHTDGNYNRGIRGASVGYPSSDLNSPHARLARAWKKWHQHYGFPGGFHKDNYTDGLRYYYGFNKVGAQYEFLAEHGTTTNIYDEAWLFGNTDKCVRAHVDAIGEIVGHPTSTPQNGSVGGIVVNGANRSQGGYALVGPDGGVFCEDGAPYFGSLPSIGVKPNNPVVSLTWTLDGNGYWLMGSDGGVFSFGSAKHAGSYLSLPAHVRNDSTRRFVAIVTRKDGGYTLVSAKNEKYNF